MIHRFLNIVAASAAIACFCAIARGQEVQSGLAFLKLDAGADAVARGGAMTAAVSGAQALFYNPAGLAIGRNSSILVMHNENILGLRNDVLGGNVAMGDAAIGLGLQAATVAGIPIRDAATTDPIGSFTSIDGALTLGAAYAVSPGISLGMNVKALIEKIYINDAFGVALDFGGMYRAPNSAWTFGLALLNLGSMGIMNNDRVALPSMARAGAAYSGTIEGNSTYAYVASADATKTFADDLIHLRAGAQFAYNGVFLIRAGYATGYDASGFSAGVGVVYRFLHVDYAISPYTQQYGLAHTISVKFDL